MKTYFAYTRVSTVKQGTQGVSLQEQKSAIGHHAQKNGFVVSEWFEETVTAAKTGRAVFTNIMKRLQKGEADGLIIHKIDRSARNLKDWAALGELIDAGIDVQVSAESYDLSSRGGRLSADIQAVIAADYIRNLREETLKGMKGRLKQGIYPLKAPAGYIDNGSGAYKTIDPIKGPLVKQAFELYATGQYSLRSLNKKMNIRGLRSSRGGNLGKNGFSRILNNPFYYGKIYIKTTGETYAGGHEPLISKHLFDQAQRVLAGKTYKKETKHNFVFRRTFTCKSCAYSLIGEHQKGHVYYRCHTSSCEMKTIREDTLVFAVDKVLQDIPLTEEAIAALRQGFKSIKAQTNELVTTSTANNRLLLTNVKARLERLMNLFIDGKVDQEAFDAKQLSLQDEVDSLEEQLRSPESNIGQILSRVEQFLELAEALISGYKTAPDDFRGELLKSVTSNPTVTPESVDIPIELPWLLFMNALSVPFSGPLRDRPRKFEVGPYCGPHRDTPRPNKKHSDALAEWTDHVLAELIEYFTDFPT